MKENADQIFMNFLADGVKSHLGNFTINIGCNDSYWFELESEDKKRYLDVSNYIYGCYKDMNMNKNREAIKFDTLDDAIKWLKGKEQNG